jgi:hypothetical protein
MPFVSAHFGHWYISGPVYLSPVLLLVIWSSVTQRRDRRRAQRERRASGTEAQHVAAKAKRRA